MNGHIANQESSYRRGLLLGFTVAEIFILITFIMLLALAAFLVTKNEQLIEKERKLEKAGKLIKKQEQNITNLRKEIARIVETESGGNFDDVFLELIIIREQLKEASKKIKNQRVKLGEMEKESNNNKKQIKERDEETVDLRRALKDLEREMNQRKKKLARLENILEKENANVGADEENNKILEVLRDIVTELSSGEKEAITQSEALNAVKELKRYNGEMERKITRLENDRKSVGGKGTDHPSCWYSKSNKTEYIFDLVLGGGGITVGEIHLPHRENDKAKLLIPQKEMDKVLTAKRFRRTMKALYDYSVEKKCRFFVRVTDKTMSDQKEEYKRLLGAIGTRFYPYEPER